MNEIFKEKLNILANDEFLLKAIKSVFYEVIEKEKPKINETSSNGLLGEQYRAYETSKQIIDKAFIKIQESKQGNQTSKNFNKER